MVEAEKEVEAENEIAELAGVVVGIVQKADVWKVNRAFWMTFYLRLAFQLLLICCCWKKLPDPCLCFQGFSSFWFFSLFRHWESSSFNSWG